MGRNKSKTQYHNRRSGFKRRAKSGTAAARSPASLESVMTPTAQQSTSSQTQSQDSVQQTMEQVGLLEALMKERSSRGFDTSSLEKRILGLDGAKSIRTELQDFIDQNAGKFSGDDPAGVAAFELMESAVDLSEAALTASQEQAKEIYAKLNFIRELAKKTQGEQSDIANKLSEVIAPVEEQLKKRASFGEFIKEKAKDFRKTIPERIASKIPVVGGILGQFLRQRRESQEELERYSGQLQRTIARGGRKSSDLFGPGVTRRPRVGMAGEGGTRASDIPGLGGGTSLQDRENAFERTKPQLFPVSTLQSIYKEVVAIRKSVQKIEKSSGRGTGGGLLDSLKDRMFGRKSRIGRLFRRGKIGVKRLFRSLKRDGFRKTMGRAFGRSSAIGKALRRGRIGVKRLMRGGIARGMGKMVGRAGGGIMRAASGLGRGVMGAASGIGNAISSGGAAVAKTGGGMLSSLWEGTKSFAKGVANKLDAFKAIGGGISGLGKVVLGAIGPLIETVFTAKDISAIKNNPELTDEQKKEEIGKRLGKAIGSIIGSVGASVALGPAGPLVTAGLDMIGIGPGALGEWLTEQLGAKGLYDIANSISPSLFGLPSETEGGKPQGGQGAAGDATGTITAPATPNTTVGKMAQQMSVEQDNLQVAQVEAQAKTAGAGTATAPVSNAVVNTKISNTTNNFNDDLRIRNNEPTLKTMQMASHTF